MKLSEVKWISSISNNLTHKNTYNSSHFFRSRLYFYYMLYLKQGYFRMHFVILPYMNVNVNCFLLHYFISLSLPLPRLVWFYLTFYCVLRSHLYDLCLSLTSWLEYILRLSQRQFCKCLRFLELSKSKNTEAWGFQQHTTLPAARRLSVFVEWSTMFA